MTDLSALTNLFVANAQPPSIAPSQDGATWQTALMEQIDPEKMKRERIKGALLAGFAKMAGTPGNFMSGLSSGLVTGAQTYNTQQQADEANRIKALQGMEQYQQSQQDRSLGMLKDAIGIQGGMEDREARRQYQADSLALKKEQAISKRAAGGGQGTSGSTGITSDVQSTGLTTEPATGSGGGTAARTGGDRSIQLEQNRRAAIAEYNKWKRDQENAIARRREMGEDVPDISPEESRAKLEELADLYGIRELYQTPAPQSAPGKTDSAAPAPAPKVRGTPKIIDGYTITPLQ